MVLSLAITWPNDLAVFAMIMSGSFVHTSIYHRACLSMRHQHGHSPCWMWMDAHISSLCRTHGLLLLLLLLLQLLLLIVLILVFNVFILVKPLILILISIVLLFLTTAVVMPVPSSSPPYRIQKGTLVYLVCGLFNLLVY